MMSPSSKVNNSHSCHPSVDLSNIEPPQKDEIKKSLEQTSDNKTFEVIDTKPSPHMNNDPSDPPTNNVDTTTETLENYEIKKKADQTLDKNTFQVLHTKPLTNANNDASGSKQEDNDDAIPSMSSASNVEDAEPNDNNMFLQDLNNNRKATKQKSSKKKKLQGRK